MPEISPRSWTKPKRDFNWSLMAWHKALTLHTRVLGESEADVTEVIVAAESRFAQG
jgi:hypothetical protein